MITESPLDPDAALYRRVVPAGEYWMHVVRKGETHLGESALTLEPGDQVLAILRSGTEEELRRALLKH